MDMPKCFQWVSPRGVDKSVFGMTLALFVFLNSVCLAAYVCAAQLNWIMKGPALPCCDPLASVLQHFSITGIIWYPKVIGLFNWPNPSSRIMALVSTQPLTEMSTRNLPVGKGRQARKADNLIAICEPIIYKMWEPRRLTNLWASTACYRDSFTCFYLYLQYPKGMPSCGDCE
jgi:hypothetical protein